MYHKSKHKVHSLLHPELGNTHWDRAINGFIITLILLNVVAVMLETVPEIYDAHKQYFRWFDVFTVAVFSVEYVLRVWSANAEKKYGHSLAGRLRYMASPGAIIDLLAILPFYVHVVIGLDLRVLRILRLFRFLRLFKLTAYMKSAKMISNVFKATYNQLMLSLVLAITLITISSSFVYFAEHNAQPTVFSSLPKTIWWSVITLTTVGYGDMVPITLAGRTFTIIILLAGVALFALPAGILTAGFLEEMRTEKGLRRKKITCPHCNTQLDVDIYMHEH
jgi:voltage-gated potassium channel